MERWSNVATGTLVRNVQSTFGQRCEPWGWANVRATFGQRSGNVQAESPRVRGHPLVQMSRRAGPAFGCRGRRSARYVSVLRFFSWQSTLTLVDSIAGCIAEVRSDGERGKRRGGGRRSMHANFSRRRFGGRQHLGSCFSTRRNVHRLTVHRAQAGHVEEPTGERGTSRPSPARQFFARTAAPLSALFRPAPRPLVDFSIAAPCAQTNNASRVDR